MCKAVGILGLYHLGKVFGRNLVRIGRSWRPSNPEDCLNSNSDKKGPPTIGQVAFLFNRDPTWLLFHCGLEPSHGVCKIGWIYKMNAVNALIHGLQVVRVAIFL